MPLKSLITDILNTDPTKRPTLDGILASDFFQMGSIPKLLPTSTLACPPSLSYIRQFMPEAGPNGIVQKPLSSTQRINNEKLTTGGNLETNSGKENLTGNPSNKMLTDRNKITLQQQYSSNANTNRPDTQQDSRPLHN